MNTMERARRRFLKEGAALAGLALGAGAVRSVMGQAPQYLEKGRIIDPMAVRSPAGGPYVADPRRDALVSPRDTLAYGERSRYVTTMRLSDGSNNGFGGESNVYTPLQDSTGIITPAPLHFVSSHGAEKIPPDGDSDTHPPASQAGSICVFLPPMPHLRELSAPAGTPSPARGPH